MDTRVHHFYLRDYKFNFSVYLYIATSAKPEHSSLNTFFIGE